MRIIAGKFKGRRLVSFKADHIRPTTDRVKETIFNMLQAHIDGARILDLFSGTGNLSIESLSRGAQFVTAVEKNRESVKIIKKNLAGFNIDEGIEVVAADVMKFLQFYKGPPFDVILIDPPFTEKLSHDVLSSIGSSQVLGDEGIMVIESAKQERVDKNYSRLIFLDQRLFGDKKITVFEVEKNDCSVSGKL